MISLLKKIPTKILITQLSKQSMNMFRKNKPYHNTVYPLRNGLQQIVMLTAWDIARIIFLSIINSNDYHGSKKAIFLGEVVEAYRKYENDQQFNILNAMDVKNCNISDIFAFITCLTSEQFIFSSMAWIFEKFNRDYYLLTTIDNKLDNSCKINIVDVFQDLFHCDLESYVHRLVILWWLCYKSPMPLAYFNTSKIKLRNVSCEDILSVVEKFSCTYYDVRASEVKHLIFYSKPIIKSQAGDYISSNLYLVAMTVANSLYWLTRDYYKDKYCNDKKLKNYFPNSFGKLFETYIHELIIEFGDLKIWQKIDENESTTPHADFIFTTQDITIIFEVKSTIIGIEAKQQYPYISVLKDKFGQSLEEAHKQLDGSYTKIRSSSLNTCIKIILLYDAFSKISIVEKTFSKIFEKDPMCFLMGIREFEIMLYYYKNSPDLFKKIIEQLVWGTQNKSKRKSIDAIYEELGIKDNPVWKDKKDFFNIFLSSIK